MKWFDLIWWKYLLEPKNNDIGWYRTMQCRAKGHPCGVYWYSSDFEPDMHCRNCDDDLG